MSIYQKVRTMDTISGMAVDGKTRFISTLVGLVFYFVAIDLINLVRRPLKRKIYETVNRIKNRNRKDSPVGTDCTLEEL